MSSETALSPKQNFVLFECPAVQQRISLVVINESEKMFVTIQYYMLKTDNTEGGEHQFDGKKFVLEAHYVHGNIKYQTAEDYQKHEDGILIIAVVFNLFDVSHVK